MRSNKKLALFRGWDILLILLILALVALTVYFAVSPQRGDRALIYLSGEKVAEIPLSTGGVWQGEHLTVVVEDGEVFVQDADCPDKICEKHKAISRSGESIVCLPNKIVVRIDGKGEVEAIT